ncbi:hypothetical protein K450DRAFT_228672 [Umbelopsis ramanniana AG]|uniref:Uncharacterized protein n=1 Tax=Umbelopsis ramanniana AG TaxID=1314678 RepID=A0AAD5HFF5_UMBRA|nr:uncharacterized protein K450DRAFT_228672 [Umbelopsis ramanniana AG]KAI8582377.1 hypothetical protein K450DRAFT_228672 [Umbelopsis ramanniana AG]
MTTSASIMPHHIPEYYICRQYVESESEALELTVLLQNASTTTGRKSRLCHRRNSWDWCDIFNVLANQGASIVVNYTSSEDRAVAIGKRIQDACSKALSVQADVDDVNGAKKIVEATVEAFGKIDIVVNNAAIGIFQVLEEI